LSPNALTTVALQEKIPQVTAPLATAYSHFKNDHPHFTKVNAIRQITLTKAFISILLP